MPTRAEEALALLDLDDTLPAEAGGEEVVSDELGSKKGPKPTKHVIKMDKWGERRGLELVRDEQTRAACGIEGAPPEEQGDGTVAPYTAEEEAWGASLADLHAAAFETRVDLNEKCKDELRQQFVQQLVETPDFEEMRVNTVMNPAAAEIATAAFAKQYAIRVAEAKRDAAQGGKGKTAPDGDILTMKAAAAACAAASSAVNEFKDACDMAGLGNGTPGGKLDRERMSKLFKRVRKSPNLARIAKLAGRFRRLAQSKQRQKVVHGADEVIGVTMGDDIGRLVPAELVKLVCPHLGLDTARRLMEKQTLVRETKASEPVGKGPIVVTVDESGSMRGLPVETAKALALALAWIARKQKRWCVLVSFSGGCKIEPGSQCILPPGRTDEAALLDWLEHFYGGGTTMDVPLVEIPNWWPKYVEAGMQRGKTDIVMITDAAVDLPPEIEKSFNAFKQAEKAKLTTLVIGGADAGQVGKVSDHTHTIPAISTDSEAVGDVLSI